jgi:hypothetical protein
VRHCAAPSVQILLQCAVPEQIVRHCAAPSVQILFQCAVPTEQIVRHRATPSVQIFFQCAVTTEQIVRHCAAPFEARFLDEIQTKVLRVFLLAIHSHLCSFALSFQFIQTHATSCSF